MIGRSLTRKDDGTAWTVMGDNGDGRWVVSPDKFGASPVALKPEQIREQFKNVRSAPSPERADEQGAWRQLGRNFMRALNPSESRRPKSRRKDGVLTPEERFRGLERKRAEELAQDPEAVADFGIGLLPVSEGVARELDAILAARDASETPLGRRVEPNIGPDEARRRLGHR